MDNPQSTNGNGAIVPALNPRYTAENIPPEKYRKIVELLVEPREQVSYQMIEDICHADRRTIAAVEARESATLPQLKERLLRKAARVAHKAIDRVEDQIESANISGATIAFGVATEKMLLLAGEATAILEVNPGRGFADLYEKLNNLKPANTPKTIEATVVDEHE